MFIIDLRIRHRAQCVQMGRAGLTALLVHLGLCPGRSSSSAMLPKHREHSEFSDFRGTLAGWVRISVKQQLLKSLKVGFREENQRCLVLVRPSAESSITSVLGSNSDRWNLKLVHHQPRTVPSVLNSGLELFSVEQPPSDWRCHARKKKKGNYAFRFRYSSKLPAATQLQLKCLFMSA